MKIRYKNGIVSRVGVKERERKKKCGVGEMEVRVPPGRGEGRALWDVDTMDELGVREEGLCLLEGGFPDPLIEELFSDFAERGYMKWLRFPV